MQARERVSILTADYASVLAILLACWVVTMPGGTRAEPPRQLDDKTEFLRLCDLACEELNKDITPFEEKYRTVIEAKTHHVPFFEDSYAVRALAVAYDMTGKEQYLGTCKRWADRVVAFQDKMVPKGGVLPELRLRPPAGSDFWWVVGSRLRLRGDGDHGDRRPHDRQSGEATLFGLGQGVRPTGDRQLRSGRRNHRRHLE